jgi:hypothetical protein
MKLLITIIAVCLFNWSNAQTTPPPPCTAPEAKQFDFWIGQWDLTWADSLHGTNDVERVWGSCAVQENFRDPKTNFLGKSWSVYSVPRKQWQQTWIDNQGGYIALTGGMQGDSMVLTTPERLTPKGKMASRMVYYNITASSFDWSWEASTDGGATWKPGWRIHYQRRK